MKMIKFHIFLLLFVYEAISKPVNEYENTLDYLQEFGYMSANDKVELSKYDSDIGVKNKQFKRALEDLQIHGHIPATGAIDKQTIELMAKPRCGVIDDRTPHKRRKRFDLMSTKWDKRNLSWSFNDKSQKYDADTVKKIRNVIKAALDVWQEHGVLKFTEIYPYDSNADIQLSFVNRNHSEIDIYVLSPNTLGHAFQPGNGLGGDGHFRNDINWDFDALYKEEAAPGRTGFYAVVLHELGHALGLAHSKLSDAVMYEFYTANTSTLAFDDIRGLQYIYGIPKGKKYRTTTEKPESEESVIWDTSPKNTSIVPNKCNTSYDAIANIDNEVMVFKSKYMFRPGSSSGDPIPISRHFSNLPEKLTHVDAVYQTTDGPIYVFINQTVFIYSKFSKFDSQKKLTDFGLPSDVEKIDAMFKWSSLNGRTYIISGNSYWRFTEKDNKVEKSAASVVENVFKDVYDFDTAFEHEKKLLFFKNEHYFEFDSYSMTLKRMQPKLSANKIFNCGLPEIELDNRMSLNDDFIDLGANFFPHKEDKDNPEGPDGLIGEEATDKTTNGDGRSEDGGGYTIYIVITVLILLVAIAGAGFVLYNKKYRKLNNGRKGGDFTSENSAL